MRYTVRYWKSGGSDCYSKEERDFREQRKSRSIFFVIVHLRGNEARGILKVLRKEEAWIKTMAYASNFWLKEGGVWRDLARGDLES